MPFILVVGIFMGALAILAPRAGKYMVAAPICGITFGSFAWAVAGIKWGTHVSLQGYITYVMIATVVALILCAIPTKS
jgi:hypothetical protein